jgi:ribonuclease Z
VLNLEGIAVDAVSIGGLETCIQLPGFDLAFDIGRCPPTSVHRNTLLFTHAHIDHMGGITWHAATRSLMHLQPPTYLVPSENVAAIEALFEATRRLDQSELPHTLVPIGPGDEHVLACGLVARPFRSVHVVPCQGYAIWERKKKLKAEYSHLSGAQIRDLRVEKGVEVTDTIEAPVVAFCGDTRIEVLKRESVVREARLLILECTFIDERVSVEKCRERGHIHLDEIAEHADLFENKAILLTHFSARYTADDIRKALDEKLPPGLRERVTPLLNGHGGSDE